MSISVDADLLREFEEGLDPKRPEAGRMPARILGYGEISTVFEVQAEGLEGLAVKRMPIFKDREEMDSYRGIYLEYNRLLEEEVGLLLPAYGYAEVVTSGGRPVFYILQEKVPPESIGNQAIHVLDREGVVELVRIVLRELRRVWDYNRRRKDLEVALDGQISNWSIPGFDPRNPRLDPGMRLLYLDTSTPLFRVKGVEQLDPELFLRSAPSFLLWIIRLLFLQDVMTRYYDFRSVTIDLIANFYKEQRSELVPVLVEAANRYFAEEAPGLGISPITVKEVDSYYREDALIWSLYLNLRRLDRFLRTRLLGQEYPYILPGKIRRRPRPSRLTRSSPHQGGEL
ncbi:MAG: DUF6206 family protein [Actinomycetota bacterium]